MQPSSLQAVQQKVLSLNSADQPYQFSVSGNSIVGDWKIADVKWAAILGAGTIDKQYSITVTLDEPTHTYIFNEHKTDSERKVNFNPLTGNISFGKSNSSFSGKMSGFEIGGGAGTVVEQNDQQQGHTYQYSFDTKKIKEPLFTALEQAGWQQKKGGFFSKLFKS